MAPERYVTLVELREEVVYGSHSFRLSDADYDDLLTRILDEESERMEGEFFAARTWEQEDSPDDDPPPGPVKDGIIRLVRSRLDRIQSDGIASESTTSGHSSTFRPSAEIMEQVASAVGEYRPSGDSDTSYGAWVV